MKQLINVFKVSSTILEKQGLTDPITDTQAGLSPRVRLWIVYVVVFFVCFLLIKCGQSSVRCGWSWLFVPARLWEVNHHLQGFYQSCRFL